MIWSELEIATLREESHPLLVRAGYRRGAEWLFLGRRALSKIEALLRNESDRGRALERCGVAFVRAGADFVAESKTGDDVLVQGTDYSALLSRAVSVAQPPAVADAEGDRGPEEFLTPGVKTIAQVAEFTRLPATSQIKSLVMVTAGGDPVLVLLRGDHQLSSAKFGNAQPATAEAIRGWFGADPGSLGPVGVSGMRIVTDEALRGRRNMIAGANRNDYHLRHVTPGKDFAAEFADVRLAVEGDTCIHGGPLRFPRVAALDTAEQILETAVEQNRDQDGIVVPAAIAPFTVVLTPVHPERLEAARAIYSRLLNEGHDALLDDRDARPGVKFKDADLIGIPYRINVGKKLSEGWVELVERATHRSQDVPAEAVSIPR